MPPKSPQLRATAASKAAPSRTSVGRARASPPPAAIASAVCSVRSASMSSTATRAPKSAKARAMPRPMPAPAPVTTALRPSRKALDRSMDGQPPTCAFMSLSISWKRASTPAARSVS